MKIIIAILSLALVPSVASAQSPDPSKWMCRNLADSGGFTYQGETLFGNQACRPIAQAAPVVAKQQFVASASAEATPVPSPAPTTTNSTPASDAPPTASAIASDGKTRVFVTDSQSWETRGGSSAGGNKNGWGGSSWMAGGARPQTAEIIKTLNERCPEMTVTNNLQKADFVLTLDHEGGKGLLAHRNKVAVFNRDGDDIFSASTRELGNSVKDACAAMLNQKK